MYLHWRSHDFSTGGGGGGGGGGQSAERRESRDFFSLETSCIKIAFFAH